MKDISQSRPPRSGKDEATMGNGPEESLKQMPLPWCLSPGRDNMLIKILIK